jgi:hypothetical protein
MAAPPEPVEVTPVEVTPFEVTPFEVTIDPFARHRGFAGWVRTGKLRTSFQRFLEHMREPIDVRADRILDLAAFGQVPHQFLKMPRPKRPDELPEGFEDRMKDLERQFILRNLRRFVKTVDRNDPLEFEKKEVGVKLDLDTRKHLADLHRRPELLGDTGLEQVRNELAWRHRFLEVMQWERYFCKEIKDDFDGPLWKHDPETNPIQAKAADEAIATSPASTSSGVGGSDTSAGET